MGSKCILNGNQCFYETHNYEKQIIKLKIETTSHWGFADKRIIFRVRFEARLTPGGQVEINGSHAGQPHCQSQPLENCLKTASSAHLEANTEGYYLVKTVQREFSIFSSVNAGF